jgi:putative polyketide hydroxylase
MDGPGVLTHAVSILFEADLPKLLPGAGSYLYYLRNSGFVGAFVTCDDPRLGQLNVEYDPQERDPRDFTPARCREFVQMALGAPNLDVKLHDVLPWQMAALVARQFSNGRIFLVGDAAHLTPPVGGLGGQGGIQDAANLAWKLAFVIKGYAGPGLLDSYERERLPVAHLANARGIANYVERMRPDRSDIRMRDKEADYLNVVFGHRYRSAAIDSDPHDDGSSSEDPCVPSVAPGFRMPHAEICLEGKHLSLHDLTGKDFVLLIGRTGEAWTQAAKCFAAAANFPLRAYRIDAELNATHDLHSTLRIEEDDALLVRPDGFVAWRATGSHDATDRLSRIMNEICARSAQSGES